MSAGLPGARLRRVTDFIDDNLARALPLAQLSAEAHLSQYHFARLFKESTGLPPHRFVVQRRIERACALLIDGQMSIDAIARAVGFRTRSHFSMVFHRHTGSPPTVYRAFASSRKTNGDVHDQAGQERQMT
jgi:AraC family transcriptional regulator